MRKFLFSIFTAAIFAVGFTGGSADAASKAVPKSGVYVTTADTIARADASNQYKKVLTLKKGTRVQLTHEKQDGAKVWYKVLLANGKKGYVLSNYLTRSTGKSVAAETTVSGGSGGVVKTAMALRGIPYRFGGTTTRGFDCSGFTQYAFKKNGKSVPRTTGAQYQQSKKVSAPAPGDLVFFHNTYKRGISHVGIYIGNNQFVHAGGKKAEVVSLNNSYWKSKFNSFRRI